MHLITKHVATANTYFNAQHFYLMGIIMVYEKAMVVK